MCVGVRVDSLCNSRSEEVYVPFYCLREREKKKEWPIVRLSNRLGS